MKFLCHKPVQLRALPLVRPDVIRLVRADVHQGALLAAGELQALGGGEPMS